MLSDSKSNELIKLAPDAIARYSSALVKRAIQDLEGISTQASSLVRVRQNILVLVDLDPKSSYKEFFSEMLNEVGIDAGFVDPAYGLESVYAELSRTQYDMIIPSNLGLWPIYIPKLVEEVKKRFPQIKIVVVSGHCPLGFVNYLARKGIDDFFYYPFEPDDPLSRIKELLSKAPSIVSHSQRRITLLLSYRMDESFVEFFERMGFKVFWSNSAQETERMIKSSQIDLAIEWQNDEQNFPIRNLLRIFGRETSVLLAVDWDRPVPPNLEELGFVDSLVVHFDLSEIRQKFLEALPLTRHYLYHQTKLWTEHVSSEAQNPLRPPDTQQTKKSATDWFQSAYMKSNLKDYQGAILDLTRAINLNPGFAQAYYNRGLAEFKVKDYSASIVNYTQAIYLKPDFVDAFINRAGAKRDSGDHQGAINDFTMAITLEPDLANAYVGRGVVKDELGDHQEAIVDYTNAIALISDLADAYLCRGGAYLSIDQQSKALMDFMKAIELGCSVPQEVLDACK